MARAHVSTVTEGTLVLNRKVQAASAKRHKLCTQTESRRCSAARRFESVGTARSLSSLARSTSGFAKAFCSSPHSSPLQSPPNSAGDSLIHASQAVVSIDAENTVVVDPNGSEDRSISPKQAAQAAPVWCRNVSSKLASVAACGHRADIMLVRWLPLSPALKFGARLASGLMATIAAWGRPHMPRKGTATCGAPPLSPSSNQAELWFWRGGVSRRRRGGCPPLGNISCAFHTTYSHQPQRVLGCKARKGQVAPRLPRLF